MEKNKSKNSTVEQQHNKRGAILKALPESFGIVSSIANKARCDRKTVYNWIEKDEQIKKLFTEERESLIDLAEIKLIEKLEAGNESMIALVLKTLGKSRGYIEGKIKTIDEEKLNQLKELFDQI